MATAKYVYGVVRAGATPPKTTGIGRRRLQTVKDGGLAAIVSNVDASELRAGREDVLAHSRVLGLARAAGAVLPMRFGVVMPDSEAVRAELLEPHREELEAQLRHLTGKVELHVRALYEEDVLMSEIVSSRSDIGALSAAVRERSPDAAYYQRIDLGQRVAEAVDEARARDSEAILNALEPFADMVEIADPAHEREAARLLFLVDEARLPEFDEAVDDLGRINAERLRFKYTGPLPPYSFVAIPGEG